MMMTGETGIPREFAAAPTLDTQRRSAFQDTRRDPTGFSMFGHQLRVDLVTGNLVVTTSDLSYDYQGASFGVARRYDMQEQHMQAGFLATHANVDPRPHAFSNWQLRQEADIEEVWLTTSYELQVSAPFGPSALLRESNPGFCRHVRGDPTNTLATYGVPGRTLAQLGWRFAPGDLLLRTDRGPFLIASGTLEPETLVDPLNAAVWIFNPITGQAWLLSSELYFDVTAGAARDVGFPLLTTTSVDALGHFIRLTPGPGPVPPSLTLSNGAGQSITLALERTIAYPDGRNPGGTVWRHTVTSATDETKAQYNRYAYEYDPASLLLTHVSLPSSIGVRSVDYGYGDPAFPGTLTSIANSAGDELTFAYAEDPLDLDDRLNARLKVREITDPTGVTFEYTPDYPNRTVAASVSQPAAGFARRTTTYTYLQDEDTSRRYVTRTTTTVTVGFALASGALNALPAPQIVSTTAVYTDDGRFNLAETVDPIGRTAGYTYNDFNQVTESVDIGGRLTQYVYDLPDAPAPARPRCYDLLEVSREGLLRTITSTTPFAAADAVTAVVTKYTYQPYNAATSGDAADYEAQSTHRIATFANALGRVWTCQYDDAASFSPLQATTVITPLGRTSRHQFDAKGNPIQIIDAEGNATTLEYSAQGQLMRYVDANGAVTEVAYYPCGNWVHTITDPVGAVSEVVREVDGKITQTVEPQGQTLGYRYYPNEWASDIVAQRPSVKVGRSGYQTLAFVNLATHFAYSPLGRLTAVTEPRGVTMRYERDELDRLVRWYQEPQPMRSVDYAYDPAGQLVGKSDQRGMCTQYGYSQAGYLESTKFPAWNNGVKVVAGKEVQNTLLDFDGRTLTQSDSERPGALQRGYDATGAVVFEQEPGGFTYEVEYDEDGGWIKVYDPDGACDLDAQRDNLGRVATLTDSAVLDGSVQYAYLYRNPRATGGKVLHLFERAVAAITAQTTFGYDPRGALTGLNHIVGGASQFGQQLAYDASARLANVTGDNATSFTYDALSQLIYESGSALVCDYDEAGNRAFRTANPIGAPAATFEQLNRLLTEPTTGQKFTYDATGDLETETIRARASSYFFDGMGMLRRVERGTRVVEYLYDGSGKLVERRATNAGRVATTELHYVFGRMVRADENGAMKTLHTWDPVDGSLLRVRQPQAGGATALPNSTFVLVDGFASIVRTVDGAGAVTKIPGYDVWGVPVAPMASQAAAWGWKGLEYDDETELVRSGARWYNPVLGRWISEDPLPKRDGGGGVAGLAGISNLYAYVGNSPATRRDSSGYAPDDALSSWWAATIGVGLFDSADYLDVNVAIPLDAGAALTLSLSWTTRGPGVVLAPGFAWGVPGFSASLTGGKVWDYAGQRADDNGVVLSKLEGLSVGVQFADDGQAVAGSVSSQLWSAEAGVGTPGAAIGVSFGENLTSFIDVIDESVQWFSDVEAGIRQLYGAP
jgi:RHS repeat-associated protein